MNSTTQFENLSTTDRVIRSVVSVAAVVGTMGTNLVGTAAFTAVSVVAIALATTAIIGWDPLKSASLKLKSLFSRSEVSQTEKHA